MVATCKRTALGSPNARKVETIGAQEAQSPILASSLCCRAPLVRPTPRVLALLAQLVAVDPGVPQDAVERAALEFALQRHDEQSLVLRVFEAHTAAALAHRLPAQLV